jgi:hypothetical protein
VAVALAFVIASLAFRVLYWEKLETSALMFIGVPFVLSVALAFTPPARSAVGMVMKGITIGLLLSAILFGEGVVCVLMAAPLCYVVGLFTALAIQRFRGRRSALCLALSPLALLSLEGSSDRLSLPREETVTVERHVDASPLRVEEALARAPRFRTPLPAYLRLFPRPQSARGSGLEPGDLRIVLFGDAAAPEELVLVVARRTPASVTFVPLEDHTMIAHWLSWREAEVDWAPVPGGTRVRWTLRYRRGLDPAWYFRPWERYAVARAGSYLIDDAATPADARAE